MLHPRFRMLAAVTLLIVGAACGFPHAANATNIQQLQAVVAMSATETAAQAQETTSQTQDAEKIKKQATSNLFNRVVKALSDLLDKDKKTKDAIVRNIKG